MFFCSSTPTACGLSLEKPLNVSNIVLPVPFKSFARLPTLNLSLLTSISPDWSE